MTALPRGSFSSSYMGSTYSPGPASPPGKITNFLTKLYSALRSHPGLDEIMYWAADGKQLVVANPQRLEAEFLPIHYKHSKFTSFGRQLNIYGFSRVYPGRQFEDANGNIANDASVWAHPTLHRESSIDAILSVKRRAPPKPFRGKQRQAEPITRVRYEPPQPKPYDRPYDRPFDPPRYQSNFISSFNGSSENSYLPINRLPPIGTMLERAPSIHASISSSGSSSNESALQKYSLGTQLPNGEGSDKAASPKGPLPPLPPIPEEAPAIIQVEAQSLPSAGLTRGVPSPQDIIQAINQLEPRRRSWTKSTKHFPLGIATPSDPTQTWTTPATPRAGLARLHWPEQDAPPKIRSPLTNASGGEVPKMLSIQTEPSSPKRDIWSYARLPDVLEEGSAGDDKSTKLPSLDQILLQDGPYRPTASASSLNPLPWATDSAPSPRPLPLCQTGPQQCDVPARLPYAFSYAASPSGTNGSSTSLSNKPNLLRSSYLPAVVAGR